MALWHFTVELVPIRREGAVLIIESGHVDTAALWADYGLTAGFVANEIDLILPRAPSGQGCDALARWGDKANDLQLWSFEDGRISTLTARLDCRIVSPAFIKHVAQIALTLGLSAILPGQVVTVPTAELLISCARRSLAATFALPPQGTA